MFLVRITKKEYIFLNTDTICHSNALFLHCETKKTIITKTFLNNSKTYFRED